MDNAVERAPMSDPLLRNDDTQALLTLYRTASDRPHGELTVVRLIAGRTRRSDAVANWPIAFSAPRTAVLVGRAQGSEERRSRRTARSRSGSRSGEGSRQALADNDGSESTAVRRHRLVILQRTGSRHAVNPRVPVVAREQRARAIKLPPAPPFPEPQPVLDRDQHRPDRERNWLR